MDTVRTLNQVRRGSHFYVLVHLKLAKGLAGLGKQGGGHMVELLFSLADLCEPYSGYLAGLGRQGVEHMVGFVIVFCWCGATLLGTLGWTWAVGRRGYGRICKRFW